MAKVCQEIKQKQSQLPQLYAVVDQESSELYIIKLLTIAVSTIAYLKNIYNEDDYAEFSIKGATYKVLKVKPENPECKHLLGLLKGAFDAIRKQYLRELVLGIYTDPKDREGSFVESFNFLFEYADGNHVTLSYKPNEEGKSSSKKRINRKDVNSISKDLLDVLNSFCSNSSFIERKEYLTMKFYYYSNTPADYQPPGFRRADENEYHYLKESKLNAATIATVKTPWHSLGFQPVENRSISSTIHQQDPKNILQANMDCIENDIMSNLKNLAMSPKDNVTQEFGTPLSALGSYHGGCADAVVSSSPTSPVLSLVQEPVKDVRRGRKISHGTPAPSSYFGSKRLKKNSTNNFSTSANAYNLDDTRTPANLKSPDLKRNFIPSVATSESDVQSLTLQNCNTVNALFEMRCCYPVTSSSSPRSPETLYPSAEPATATRKDLVAALPSNPPSRQALIDDALIVIKCICESQFLTDILLQCSFCETPQHPICYNIFQFDQATLSCHVCIECSKTHGFYTAVDIKDLSDEERRLVALNRLLLYRVSLQNDRKLNVVDEAASLLMPLDVVQQAVSILEEFGAFKKKRSRGSRGIYYINRDKASQAFSMYFSGQIAMKSHEEEEKALCRKRKLLHDGQCTKKLKFSSLPHEKANTLRKRDFSCE